MTLHSHTRRMPLPKSEESSKPLFSQWQLWFSLGVGLGAAAFVWTYYDIRPKFWADFDALWIAARAILAGRDPYVEVPRAFPWPFYYPASAALVALPFAVLSLPLARAAFAGLLAGLATWALARYRTHALPLLLAAPFFYAVYRVQWSPLILAGCFLPVLASVMAVKPTVGLAAWVYRPSRVAVFASALLVVISLAILPRWPIEWLGTFNGVLHFRSPILLPWGWILVLVVFRWRRPEARLFAILAVAPQTIAPYELLPLAVVPATLRESLVMAVGWDLAYYFRVTLNQSPLPSHAAVTPNYFPGNWWAELVFGYLPALFLILRRPNSSVRPGSRENGHDTEPAR